MATCDDNMAPEPEYPIVVPLSDINKPKAYDLILEFLKNPPNFPYKVNFCNATNALDILHDPPQKITTRDHIRSEDKTVTVPLKAYNGDVASDIWAEPARLQAQRTLPLVSVPGRRAHVNRPTGSR